MAFTYIYLAYCKIFRNFYCTCIGKSMTKIIIRSVSVLLIDGITVIIVLFCWGPRESTSRIPEGPRTPL